MDTKQAIKDHGAKAVYEAASHHMADGRSLADVGLTARGMGDVWQIQSEAYGQMSEADKAIDYAANNARLEEMRDAVIHLRVAAGTKASWVRESRAAGMRLSDWIVERVERTD